MDKILEDQIWDTSKMSRGCRREREVRIYDWLLVQPESVTRKKPLSSARESKVDRHKMQYHKDGIIHSDATFLLLKIDVKEDEWQILCMEL